MANTQEKMCEALNAMEIHPAGPTEGEKDGGTEAERSESGVLHAFCIIIDYVSIISSLLCISLRVLFKNTGTSNNGDPVAPWTTRTNGNIVS